MKLTPEQEKLAVKSLIESGELDLGFCRLEVKTIKGSRGRSGNTIFKRSNHHRIGVMMADWFKKLLN